MKLIVAGSRTYRDYYTASKRLSARYKKSEVKEVLCGLAAGPDFFGELWAIRNGIKVSYYPAPWEEHGKKAGMMRNRQMGKDGTHLCAFWDGRSPGTLGMIEFATKLNLKVAIEEIK